MHSFLSENEKKYVEERAYFRVYVSSLTQKTSDCQKTHYRLEELKEGKQ